MQSSGAWPVRAVCDGLALKAMSISGSQETLERHTRVTSRDRLLVFSLHHNDEEDSAFVPAAEPADSPIIDMIAERRRLAKP